MMQRFFGRLFPKSREKIEIRIETNESWEIQRLQKTRIKHCPKCCMKTIFVPSDLGNQIVRIDEETITDLIAEGKLHLSNSPETKSFICLQSLKDELGKDETDIKIVESKNI